MGLGFDRLWCDGSFLTVCLLLNQGDFIPFVQNMVGRLKNSALKTYIYDQMGAGTSQSNLPLHRLQQRCHTVPQLDCVRLLSHSTGSLIDDPCQG